ncbi:MAG: slipin family protein [Pseudomonadota bacterium]
MTTATRAANPNKAAEQRTLFDILMGRRRLTVLENQRAILLRRGKLETILGPGQHMVPVAEAFVEVHNLNSPEFVSAYERALFNERRKLADAHLDEFITGPDEMGVLLRDRRIYGLLKPDGRSVLWRAAGPFTMERVPLSDDLSVPAPLMRRLERFGQTDKAQTHHVAAEQAGLLFLDGAFTRRLEPGTHMFWNVGRKVVVKLVDLRRQPLEVGGQEILTRDRVSLRVNLVAEYRVADPVKAVTAVQNYSEALYRALQYALRNSLGARTLDEILEQKVGVDAEAAGEVRQQMAEIGLEVGEIALKDVILPGEMRTILNEVVLAEKQAQANVIRRREETAATRSLLNTARVMAENPIMLRLKELEALETIAERVDRLVIHNGAQGLMGDLVRLSDDSAPSAEDGGES